MNPPNYWYPGCLPSIPCGGGITHREINRLKTQIRREIKKSASKVCCPPVLSPEARRAGLFPDNQDPHFGQFFLAVGGLGAEISMGALHVDGLTAELVVDPTQPPPGGTIEITDVVVTPGELALVTITLNTLASNVDDKFFIKLTNDCGCSTIIEIILEDQS